jgi:hypothetical protein
MSSFQLMCKVIVLQLISNVVPKVSPKHNIVILWYLSYIYLGSSVCHIPVIFLPVILSYLRNAELFFMF